MDKKVEERETNDNAETEQQKQKADEFFSCLGHFGVDLKNS